MILYINIFSGLRSFSGINQTFQNTNLKQPCSIWIKN